VRVVLFVLAVVLALLAIAVIALLIWIRFDSSFESQFRQIFFNGFLVTANIYTGLVVTFWVLIGLCIAVFIVNAFTCVITVFPIRALFGVIALLLLVEALLQLGVGIFVIAIRPRIRNEIHTQLMTVSNRNLTVMASLESRFSCCGVDNSIVLQRCVTASWPFLPPCSVAIWNQLARILLGSGIFALVVIVLELIMAVFSFIACLNYTSKEYHDDDFSVIR